MEKYLHHAFYYIQKDSEKIQADLFYFIAAITDGICGKHLSVTFCPCCPENNSTFYHSFERFDLEEIKKLPLKRTNLKHFQEILDEYFFLNEG